MYVDFVLFCGMIHIDCDCQIVSLARLIGWLESVGHLARLFVNIWLIDYYLVNWLLARCRNRPAWWVCGHNVGIMF